MKNKNLALVAVLFTISVVMAFANGPTPQVVIDTDQIVDGAVTILKTDGVAANDLSNVTPATGRSALGLGTMAVVNSPVPVANGGTGATTAAEALAALGGASLNGSSTVNFAAADLTADSYFVSASNASVLNIPTSYVLASFTEDIDQGSDFTGSVFTAPATGVYVVTCSVQWNSSVRAVGDKVILRLLKNGAAFGPALATAEKIGTEATKQITGSTYIYLTQNETIGLGLIATTATVTTNSGVYNWLQINKLASR